MEEESMVEILVQELDEERNVKNNGYSSNSTIRPTIFIDDDIRSEFLKLKADDTIVLNPLKATGGNDSASLLLSSDEEGKNVESDKDYLITVKKIKNNVLAEINDELFEAIFPDEDIHDEAVFRERVRKEASKYYQSEVDKHFLHVAMDKLYEQTEISLPDEFMKRWLLDANKGKLPKEEIERDYDKIISKSLKMQLIEEKLTNENEDLQVTNADIVDDIKESFKRYFPVSQEEGQEAWEQNLTGIAVDYMKKNEEDTQKIHDRIYDQRLLTLFKSKLKLIEKEISYADFLSEASKIYLPEDSEEKNDDAEQTDDQSGEKKQEPEKTEEKAEDQDNQ